MMWWKQACTARTSAARVGSAISPPPAMLLVRQAHTRRSAQRRTASAISGRTRPWSRPSTRRPSRRWPSAVASASNNGAKASTSTSLRSSWAQALVSGLVALSDRISPSGNPFSRS
jgi:hypothetical protein